MPPWSIAGAIPWLIFQPMLSIVTLDPIESNRIHSASMAQSNFGPSNLRHSNFRFPAHMRTYTLPKENAEGYELKAHNRLHFDRPRFNRSGVGTDPFPVTRLKQTCATDTAKRLLRLTLRV